MVRVKIWAQSDNKFKNYSYLSESTISKIWISCVDKASLSDGKNTVQAKQWHGPIYQPLRSGRIWHKVDF